ncbi:unnamed protein product [Rhizophagus irregularis]|nr:unnamed protein product [Rhizophagus irregularis]
MEIQVFLTEKIQVPRINSKNGKLEGCDMGSKKETYLLLLKSDITTWIQANSNDTPTNLNNLLPAHYNLEDKVEDRSIDEDRNVDELQRMLRNYEN